MVIKIDAQHGWQKERERERERDAYEIWQRMGSRVAKFRVGTRAKGGNRASTSRKLKPIKHNGERRSEGFTGIAISHDHLIISLQSCHFAFVELATCLECSRTNVVDDTRSPSLEERENRTQVPGVAAWPTMDSQLRGYLRCAIWSRSVLYRYYENPDPIADQIADTCCLLFSLG